MTLGELLGHLADTQEHLEENGLSPDDAIVEAIPGGISIAYKINRGQHVSAVWVSKNDKTKEQKKQSA